ncbi:MAG: DUF1223 domain-containing protein [Pseudomonadales bacterium]|nr:DUF1223 domain-containing protein [Pseudomonadales bacterium]
MLHIHRLFLGLFIYTLAMGSGNAFAAMQKPDTSTEKETELDKQFVEFISSVNQTTLIELYTSEGCSSCPVADSWLANFKTNKTLWHEIIPLAFHVDYWNYLGWEDKYSNSANTLRQALYKEQGRLRSIYTPGFVINGQEWRGFFNPRMQNRFPKGKQAVGILRLRSSQTEAQLEFQPSALDTNLARVLIANVAYLAMDIKSTIRAGENRGTTLPHNFVVIKHDQWPLEARHHPLENHYTGQRYIHAPKNATAIAAWVSPKDNLRPIQAVGGWLD